MAVVWSFSVFSDVLEMPAPMSTSAWEAASAAPFTPEPVSGPVPVPVPGPVPAPAPAPVPVPVPVPASVVVLAACGYWSW
jgi:hypothetical protein